MARGGSVYERTNADGSQVHVVVWRDASGRQCKKTIREGVKAAERFLTSQLGARDRGETRAPDQPFKAYAEAWLEAKKPRLEASTHRDYDAHLRLRLVPALGKLRLRQITRDRVELYLADLDERRTEDDERVLSRKTINDSLIPLRQILARAVRDGIVSANAAASTDRDDPLELPYEAPAMRYLDRDQAPAYLAACEGWYRPLAEVLIGAGLRIGEALALDWRDVDWNAAALRVERTVKRTYTSTAGIGSPKGDRARSVLVDPFVLKVLRDHRTATGALSGLIFRSSTGTALDRHNVRRRGHDATLDRGRLDPAVRLHDLRHTAATLWLASGQSIYFVQQQLGHADIQTTIDLYGHPDQAAHREAATSAAAWWRTGS